MVLNRVRDWAITDGIIFKAYYEPHYDEVTIGRIVCESVVKSRDKLEVRGYFESLDGRTRTPYTSRELDLNPEKDVNEAFDEIIKEVENLNLGLVFGYIKAIAGDIRQVYSGRELVLGRIEDLNKNVQGACDSCK